MAATNAVVNKIKNKLTKRLPCEVATFNSINMVGDNGKNPIVFPSGFLDAFQLLCIAKHKLRLKENVVDMI